MLLAAVLGALALAGCADDGSGGDGGAPCERTYVTDDSCRALTLHGVNNTGNAKHAPGHIGWTEKPDVLRLSAEWGFNLARHLVFWDGIEPEKGAFDEAYLDAVVERLDWYVEAGVYAILDMHQDIYSEEFGGNGAPPWAVRDDGQPFFGNLSPWWLTNINPAVLRSYTNFWTYQPPNDDLQDHFLESWMRLVERVHDHPAVLGYDLYNEPFGGGLPYGDWEAVYLTPFYQRLVDAIRTVDDDAWIFLEPQSLGPNFGVPSSLQPVTDPRDGLPRLAFYPHFYQPGVEGGGVYEGDPLFMDWWQRSRTADVERLGGLPLLIGEFGTNWDGEGHLQYFVDLLAMLDRAGGVGWTYWDYTLGGSWSPIDGEREEQPHMQILVRPYAQRIAGRPIAQAFDQEKATLTLVFASDRAARGPTVIHVPPRHYPAGWTLEASDPGTTWAHDEATELLAVTTDPAVPEHRLVLAPAG